MFIFTSSLLLILFLLWFPVIILVCVSLTSFCCFGLLVGASLATDAAAELVTIAEGVATKVGRKAKKLGFRVSSGVAKKGVKAQNMRIAKAQRHKV